MVDTDARPDDRPDHDATQPTMIVAMGVSGSGKSTLGRNVADIMGWDFAEGDDFHSEANVAKMHGGTPLTDEDRWPWLRSIAAWISEHERSGRSAVVTCSALKRVYRDLLREGNPHVRFLHIVAPHDLIADRLAHRSGHYMPASLLDSQFDTLEDLDADEPGVVVEALGTPDETLAGALIALGISPPPGSRPLPHLDLPPADGKEH